MSRNDNRNIFWKRNILGKKMKWLWCIENANLYWKSEIIGTVIIKNSKMIIKMCDGEIFLIKNMEKRWNSIVMLFGVLFEEVLWLDFFEGNCSIDPPCLWVLYTQWGNGHVCGHGCAKKEKHEQQISLCGSNGGRSCRRNPSWKFPPQIPWRWRSRRGIRAIDYQASSQTPSTQQRLEVRAQSQSRE